MAYSNPLMSSSDNVIARGASTFLQELQARGIGVNAESVGVAIDASSRLLLALSDNVQHGLPDLLKLVGLPVGELLDNLDRLQKVKLVESEEFPDKVLWKLTAAGQLAATAIKP